jgi:hypothetical protein
MKAPGVVVLACALLLAVLGGLVFGGESFRSFFGASARP